MCSLTAIVELFGISESFKKVKEMPVLRQYLKNPLVDKVCLVLDDHTRQVGGNGISPKETIHENVQS